MLSATLVQYCTVTSTDQTWVSVVYPVYWLVRKSPENTVIPWQLASLPTRWVAVTISISPSTYVDLDSHKHDRATPTGVCTGVM